MTRVHVLVHLKPDILDVQGQAIRQAVASAGHKGVASVQMGKSFYLDIDQTDSKAVAEEVERLCRETLSNPLIENFSWKVVSA